jgi:hypothetical protein
MGKGGSQLRDDASLRDRLPRLNPGTSIEKGGVVAVSC